VGAVNVIRQGHDDFPDDSYPYFRYLGAAVWPFRSFLKKHKNSGAMLVFWIAVVTYGSVHPKTPLQL
jgi:hypothetical protein